MLGSIVDFSCHRGISFASAHAVSGSAADLTSHLSYARCEIIFNGLMQTSADGIDTRSSAKSWAFRVE